MSGFGVYKERDSFAHRLDPRVKVTVVMLMILAGFLAKGWCALGVVALFALVMVLAAGETLTAALKSLKPFLPLMVFIGLFDALFVSSGELWWSWGVMSLSSGGLLMAADCLLRFACVLMGTSVLMRVATATELSDAARLMLAPLQKVGLNTSSLSLAFGMTLRFIPVFAEELGRVREAQEARHARFDEGGIVGRVKAHVPLIVPLFASAFRRSRTLAYAVANRGFGVNGVRRTNYRVYTLHARDGVALIVGVALVVTCLVLSWLL